MGQRNNKFILCLAFLLVVILLFNIFSLFSHFSRQGEIVDKKILNASFIVGDILGFDLTPGRLSFGSIPPGSNGIRKVSIVNNFNFPISVDVFSSKEIANYISADKIENLQPGENKSITLKVNVPLENGYGNYTGIVSFIFTR